MLTQERKACTQSHTEFVLKHVGVGFTLPWSSLGGRFCKQEEALGDGFYVTVWLLLATVMAPI